jgi:hypothetical protein
VGKIEFARHDLQGRGFRRAAEKNGKGTTFSRAVTSQKKMNGLQPQAMNRNFIAILVLTIGAFLLLSPFASAQSCALCYTQAASSGARMIQALKSGILILIAPPTLMTIGAIFVCYRKRNQTRDENSEPSNW